MRRCDYCGGKLGLIIHRKWRWRFCKLARKKAHEHRQREELQRRRRCRIRYPEPIVTGCRVVLRTESFQAQGPDFWALSDVCGRATGIRQQVRNRALSRW